MDDPRLAKLSNAIANLILAIIDASGAETPEAAPEVDTPRPSRRRAAPAAASEPATQASATLASGASQETKASSQPTESKSSTAGDVVGDPDVFFKVKALTTDVAKAKGRDAAIELLSTFGVSRSTELKPDQWDEFIEAAEAILADDL
jgi:hypothetical protein